MMSGDEPAKTKIASWRTKLATTNYTRRGTPKLRRVEILRKKECNIPTGIFSFSYEADDSNATHNGCRLDIVVVVVVVVIVRIVIVIAVLLPSTSGNCLIIIIMRR